MKDSQTNPFIRKSLTLAWVIWAATMSTLLAEDKNPSSPGVAASVEIPRSVFDASPSAGKDPFFPNSTRRHKVIEAPQTTAPNTDLTKAIRLKGISGTLDKRLAIINDRTLAVGESDDFQIGNLKVNVLVKEIRRESVIVVINKADWRELKLRDDV